MIQAGTSLIKKGNRKEEQAECVTCQSVKICCERICLFQPKEGSDQISTVSSIFWSVKNAMNYDSKITYIKLARIYLKMDWGQRTGG